MCHVCPIPQCYQVGTLSWLVGLLTIGLKLTHPYFLSKGQITMLWMGAVASLPALLIVLLLVANQSWQHKGCITMLHTYLTK